MLDQGHSREPDPPGLAPSKNKPLGSFLSWGLVLLMMETECHQGLLSHIWFLPRECPSMGWEGCGEVGWGGGVCRCRASFLRSVMAVVQGIPSLVLMLVSRDQ